MGVKGVVAFFAKAVDPEGRRRGAIVLDLRETGDLRFNIARFKLAKNACFRTTGNHVDVDVRFDDGTSFPFMLAHAGGGNDLQWFTEEAERERSWLLVAIGLKEAVSIYVGTDWRVISTSCMEETARAAIMQDVARIEDGGRLVLSADPDSLHGRERAIAEQGGVDPCVAGVSSEIPASLFDEAWISLACSTMRSMGPERYFAALLEALRRRLGGKPKGLVPHRNDRCSCGSQKKYSKCCGRGVQEDDPEECKLGAHLHGEWSRVAWSGKWIRSCSRCMAVEEAPWADEVSALGTRALLIGCRHCGARPTVADAARLVEAQKLEDRCLYCRIAPPIERVVVEHRVADGKHEAEWELSMILSRDNGEAHVDTGEGGGFLHRACLPKAFPHWSVAAELAPKTKK